MFTQEQANRFTKRAMTRDEYKALCQMARVITRNKVDHLGTIGYHIPLIAHSIFHPGQVKYRYATPQAHLWFNGGIHPSRAHLYIHAYAA